MTPPRVDDQAETVRVEQTVREVLDCIPNTAIRTRGLLALDSLAAELVTLQGALEEARNKAKLAGRVIDGLSFPYIVAGSEDGGRAIDMYREYVAIVAKQAAALSGVGEAGVTKWEARRQIRWSVQCTKELNRQGLWVDARWYEALGRDTVLRMLAEFGFYKVVPSHGGGLRV